MASLSVKPGQRFTLPDWQNNSILISADAEQQRYNSHHIRQEGRALRNETGNHARWDEHNSRTQLKDRITTVDRWRETLARLLTEIDLEIDALTKIKEAAENAIQAKNLCLDVAIECLTFRESRRDIDVVRDPVEEELLREVKVIEKTKKELQQRVDDAFKQLCLLKEARQQLSSDYRHKVEALELDRQCVSFNPTSGNISFKVNPTRVPYGTTALSEWEQTSQRNKELAEAALKASVDLRGAITLTIAQTNNELDAQRIATEFALRKRIRDMEAALNELRWQEQNIGRALGTGTRQCGGHPGLLLPCPGHRLGHCQGPAGRGRGQPSWPAAGHLACKHAPGAADGELHHGGTDIPVLWAGGPALPFWVRAVLHHLPLSGPGAEPPSAACLCQPLCVCGAGEHGAAGQRGGGAAVPALGAVIRAGAPLAAGGFPPCGCAGRPGGQAVLPGAGRAARSLGAGLAPGARHLHPLCWWAAARTEDTSAVGGAECTVQCHWHGPALTWLLVAGVAMGCYRGKGMRGAPCAMGSVVFLCPAIKCWCSAAAVWGFPSILSPRSRTTLCLPCSVLSSSSISVPP
uniref:Tektin n=1 Tax=Ficedula albicollis TaxID=59894 RepID=A0A803VI74_FICAL